MVTEFNFRSYVAADRDSCLALFDCNCPKYFAPNERSDYERFLAKVPRGYEVCGADRKIVGAYGLIVDEKEGGRVNWILLASHIQGLGVGSAMIGRAIERARDLGLKKLKIAASHLSEPFFAKFGAVTVARSENGFGPGMHRHDMELYL